MRLGLACLLLITGCDLYFTNGDDDTVCAGGALTPAQQLRNPETGECSAWGFPGCEDPCLPCAAELAPAPDWGTCFGECEALDEGACLDQPGCRAVYDANSDVDQAPQFLQCWAIAPSGPAPGSCEGLDAQECSRHDNCAAYYDDRGGLLEFFACLPERVRDVCETADCAPGTHCEAQCQGGGTGDPVCSPVCVPDQDLCGTMDCAPGTECVQTCTGADPAGGCGTCTAECVPVGMCESLTSEAACVGRADCTAVYTGDNCTCYADGSCTCELLEFARCQPL